ncbi:BQ5605_C003g01907 [Microbotryum silenes-dioicae]|uniref:BQ5605_C003g01907 protein n=1 Tax=Microbotryum silenes-dioicae TaxID=796604 RepID=A0A2X0MM32_9BASI|nr:BQ5605_C003g01907 [Microbotryum silenes-dioicae]
MALAFFNIIMGTLHPMGVHIAANQTPSCTSTLNAPQNTLGLPRVRGGRRESRNWIVVRVVLAIAFSKPILARWHRYKDQPLPTPSTCLLARFAESHLKSRLRRLPEGEPLKQM